MVPTYVETGRRRVFAAAYDWPGWCRAGRDEEAALAALAAHHPRYAAVVAGAGLEPPGTEGFEVLERLAGSATTDFGAPGAIPERDHAPFGTEEAERAAAVLAAAWATLDRVAASAPPVLRKGPRGGGRDRDAVVAHVVEAEASYARQLGLRLRPPGASDAAAVAAARAAVLDALRAPPAARWPPRYAARRIAWHVLDHAWEIEDRS